jgi:hypothetical protein
VDPVVSDPVPDIIARLAKYDDSDQVIIVTPLVFIYSQWDPEATKTSHDGDRAMTRESAYRSMFLVRCVIHALEKKGIHVKLNLWNQHLLEHYEDLTPCRMDTRERKEILVRNGKNNSRRILETSTTSASPSRTTVERST